MRAPYFEDRELMTMTFTVAPNPRKPFSATKAAKKVAKGVDAMNQLFTSVAKKMNKPGNPLRVTQMLCYRTQDDHEVIEVTLGEWRPIYLEFPNEDISDHSPSALSAALRGESSPAPGAGGGG